MYERLYMAIAAIASSILLVALVFAYAVFRDAFWGATLALLTAAFLYLFQQNQFFAALSHKESAQSQQFGTITFGGCFIIGLASALLSFAGV